nr:uncharacterized protein LOC103347314 [Oryctolagus cuniculus]
MVLRPRLGSRFLWGQRGLASVGQSLLLASVGQSLLLASVGQSLLLASVGQSLLLAARALAVSLRAARSAPGRFRWKDVWPPPLCSRSPSCPLPRDDAGGQTGGPRRGLSGPQNCENHDSCSSLSARLRCNASALAREASVLRLGPALRAPSSRTLHLQKEKAHSRSECWNDRQGGAGGRAGSRRLTGGAEPGAGRDNTHRGQCGLWPHVRVSLGPSHRLPAMDPAAELPETLCSPSPPGGGACRCFRVRHQEAPAGGSSPLDRGGRGMLGYRGPVSIATGGPSPQAFPAGKAARGFPAEQRAALRPPSPPRGVQGESPPPPPARESNGASRGVNTRLFTLPASRALRGGGQGEPRGTGF